MNKHLKVLLLVLALITNAGVCAPIVESVEAEVGEAIDVKPIADALGLKVGAPLDNKKVEKGLQKLYEQKKYRALYLDTEQGEKGVYVTIHLDRRKTLKAIKFDGVDSDTEQEILEGFEFDKASDAPSPSTLRYQILQLLQREGFYFPEVSVEEREVVGETDVVEWYVSVTRNAPTRIRRLKVTGVPAYEVPRIESNLTFKKSERFDRKTIEDSLEKIIDYLKENQYPNAKIDKVDYVFTDDKLQVDVSIAVKTGERFQVEFRGNNLFRDSELRELVEKEGFFQEDGAVQGAQAIKVKYQALGYHFCDVKVNNALDPALGITYIRFDIDEGNKVYIDRVDFNLKEANLRKEIEHLFFDSVTSVIKRHIYWEAGITDALKEFQTRLNKEGYLTQSVSLNNVIFTQDKKGAQLYFDLDLGVQTKITKIEKQGITVFSDEQFNELVRLETGVPLDLELVKEKRKKLLDAYGNLGYLDVKIDESPDAFVRFSDSRTEATVVFSVNEGPKYRLGTVKLVGLKKTEPQVVLREIKIKEGDVYSVEAMKRSEDDIYLLGLFSRAEIQSSKIVRDGQHYVDLTLNLSESKPGNGEVGLGIFYEDPRLRLRPFFGLSYSNLFGLNHSLGGRAEILFPISGTSNQGVLPFIEYLLSVRYVAPYPAGVPVTLSTQIGLDRTEISPLGPILQTRARIEERVEKKLSRNLTLFYRLHRFERTKTENITTTENTIESIGSTGPGMTLDYRDNIFNPTKGSYHTAELELAHPLLLSDNFGFVMATSRNSFYFNFWDFLFLTTSLNGAYAKSILDGRPLPNARLLNDLSLGGQFSIRGFDVRQFSPVVGGVPPRETAYYNIRSELGVSLFQNFILAYFTDAGQIFPEMRPQKFEVGMGFGVRYRTPVGPLVLDLARGIGTDHRGIKLYFTVGTL